MHYKVNFVCLAMHRSALYNPTRAQACVCVCVCVCVGGGGGGGGLSPQRERQDTVIRLTCKKKLPISELS